MTSDLIQEQIENWQEAWKAGRTRFHLSYAHPALEKCFPQQTPGTVFVALCGKSLDMLWFLEKGWKVVGVEASPIACRDFFVENNLSFTETTTENGFMLFQGQNINLWCGDFFALPAQAFIDVTAGYDRAAMVALPLSLREKYARHLANLLPAGSRYMFVAVEYPQEQVAGPPFSVSAEDLYTLFGVYFSITFMKRSRDPVISSLIEKFKDVEVYEAIYILERNQTPVEN